MDLPHSVASTAKHPQALTFPTDALPFSTAVFIAAPGYYILKKKADFTPTKPNPKEMHSQSLLNPTSCVGLLPQQRISQKEEMVWRLLFFFWFFLLFFFPDEPSLN